MNPIDGYTPELRFMVNYEAQTAASVVPEQIVDQKRKYDPRRIPLSGGNPVQVDPATTRKPVYGNPYSTSDQLVAPNNVEPPVKVDGQKDTSENLRRPAKWYDIRKLFQSSTNNRHAGLGQLQTTKYRKGPADQAFRKTITGMNSMTMSPTNNPTRKQKIQGTTPPLQKFRIIPLWDSIGAKQTPVGTRQMQPSVVVPGPQKGINTAMPWNTGQNFDQSGRYIA